MIGGEHTVSCVPRDQHGLGLERADTARRVLAQIAGAYYQHPLTGQLACDVLRPLATFLRSQEAGKLVHAGEDRGHHPLGNGAAVDPAPVAESHLLWNLADEIVDPRAYRLHDPQPRHHLEHRSEGRVVEDDEELGELCILRRRGGSIPDNRLDSLGERAHQLQRLLTW